MILLPGAVLLLIIKLEWGLQVVYAGNTVCTSDHTDWYTSVIGETPCTTYERLRQICNNEYQVGTLTRNTPPDHCDDETPECCCNSISFALSMLCLACQDNTGDGFDAGVGAYQLYLMRDDRVCSPRVDRSFTITIQSAVCNTNIKIEDQLYNIFWSDGPWFYNFTKDSITRDHAAFNNKTQTRCLTTTPSSELLSSTPGPPTSPNSTPTPRASGSSGPESAVSSKADSNSQLGSGPIAGIVVGVVVVTMSLLTIIVLLILRRHRAYDAGTRQEVDPYMTNDLGSEYNSTGVASTGYLSDGTKITTPADSAATPFVLKHNRQQNSHIPISNTNTSTSCSRSSQAQGSGNITGPETSDRHVDAGPVLGANLGRSYSGRLPPAYEELLNTVGSTNQTAEVRSLVQMSYTRPEERYAQFEPDHGFPSSQGPMVQDGLGGSSIREVGSPQSRDKPVWLRTT